ncbi:MAG: hypothetical protein ACREM1_19285, partial [Longimicrobiales bacterium]
MMNEFPDPSFRIHHFAFIISGPSRGPGPAASLPRVSTILIQAAVTVLFGAIAGGTTNAIAVW